jgi:heat shock protein HslJ
MQGEDAHGAGLTHLLPGRGRARQRAGLALRDASGGVERVAETVQQLERMRVAERDQLRGAFALRGTVAADPMGKQRGEDARGGPFARLDASEGSVARGSLIRGEFMRTALWILISTSVVVAKAGADTAPLVCFGNEPSWAVELPEPTRARVSGPHERPVDYRGSAQRIEPLGEQVWRGKPAAGKGGDLVVFLREGACSDGMSDTVHPVNARVSLPDGRFLAGCCRLASSHGEAEGSSPATTRLEGPEWRLEGLSGADAQALAAARLPLSIRFDAGRVEGFSGCNRLAGNYTLEGDHIRFGTLAGTMMACVEPAATLENRFRSALQGTARYAVAGDRLTLTSVSGGVASFRQAPAPRLEGIDWEVTGYNNGREAVVSPQTGTSLSLRFENGMVSGSSGCNTFRAQYTQEGNRISIGLAASTRKICAGEGVMEQEREFLAALQAAKVWTIRDELLDMHFEGGETRALSARVR